LANKNVKRALNKKNVKKRFFFTSMLNPTPNPNTKPSPSPNPDRNVTVITDPFWSAPQIRSVFYRLPCLLPTPVTAQN